MAEERAPGTDTTGSESTHREIGTPPRNPWLERKPRPVAAGQEAEGETERTGEMPPPVRPGK